MCASHRLHANAKSLADCPTGVAFDDQIKHFRLAAGDSANALCNVIDVFGYECHSSAYLCDFIFDPSCQTRIGSHGRKAFLCNDLNVLWDLLCVGDAVLRGMNHKEYSSVFGI